ncbi:hypothetical protein [Kribbella sp. ALI-6-A]|nr:hypothetical protein [Kribbella sp. ALI-6-A]
MLSLPLLQLGGQRVGVGELLDRARNVHPPMSWGSNFTSTKNW